MPFTAEKSAELPMRLDRPPLSEGRPLEEINQTKCA